MSSTSLGNYLKKRSATAPQNAQADEQQSDVPFLLDEGKDGIKSPAPAAHAEDSSAAASAAVEEVDHVDNSQKGQAEEQTDVEPLGNISDDDINNEEYYPETGSGEIVKPLLDDEILSLIDNVLNEGEEVEKGTKRNDVRERYTEDVISVSLFDIVPDTSQPRAMIPQAYYEESLNSFPALIQIIKERVAQNDKIAQRIYEDIELLARNIENNGLIHPVTLSRIKDDNHYLLWHGERRVLAFALLFSEGNKKYEYVPCLIRDRDENEQNNILAQLSENFSREDIPAIQVANVCASFYQAAYDRIKHEQPFLDEKQLVASAITEGYRAMVSATGTNISERTFGEYVRVLTKINPSTYTALCSAKVPWRVALELSRIPQESQLDSLMEYINNNKLPKPPAKRPAKPAWSKGLSQVEKWIKKMGELEPEDEMAFREALNELRSKIDDILGDR